MRYFKFRGEKNKDKITVFFSFLSVWFATTSALSLTSCSSASKTAEKIDPAVAAQSGDLGPKPTVQQNEEVKSLIDKISSRIESLETKIVSVTDKVDATQANLELMKTARPLKASPISKMPSDSLNARMEVMAAVNDPESGFENDEPIQAYRKAMLVFRAGKYPDSVLAFSSFLEKFPDHSLAGSAQYYSGESYYKQKEFKLAIQEFQKVLTSYDRSSHVSETLRDMALAHESLKQPEEAARFRQLLSSLFPQSPAAARTDTKPEVESAMEPHAIAPAITRAITPDEPPPTAPMSPAPSGLTEGAAKPE